jgi:hypothetical protein
MMMESARGSEPGSLDAMEYRGRECREKRGSTRTSHGEQAPLEAEAVIVVN